MKKHMLNCCKDRKVEQAELDLNAWIKRYESRLCWLNERYRKWTEASRSETFYYFRSSYLVFRFSITHGHGQNMDPFSAGLSLPSCAFRVLLPEFRFGIRGNQRFSGSCDVITTARSPFHPLRSFKQTNL